MRSSFFDDLSRLGAAMTGPLLFIAALAATEPEALRPLPTLSFTIEVWRYAALLTLFGVVTFLLLEGAQRAAGGPLKGGRARRLFLFGGWWFGLSLCLDFLRAEFDAAAGAALFDLYLSLRSAVAAPPSLQPADMAAARLLLIAPALLLWLLAWALFGPAIAMAAAGRDDGPLRSLVTAGFWRRFAATLALAGALRMAALAALVAGPSGALDASLAPTQAAPWARICAGAALALAHLVEAVIAHRSFWADRGAHEAARDAFE